MSDEHKGKKPVRWRTCDECDGKGKKPVFWGFTDEDEDWLK